MTKEKLTYCLSLLTEINQEREQVDVNPDYFYVHFSRDKWREAWAVPPYGTATLNLLTSSLAVFFEVKVVTFIYGCEAWQGENSSCNVVRC